MLSHHEKNKILKARSIGPTVVRWLELAGYEYLSDFVDETPENISFRIEIATGNRRNKNALKAYANLIAWARQHQGAE